ncbi:hypothetical protein D3C75_539980 [compost metagenome]
MLQIPGNAAAAHARFGRVITEQHHQFAVFNIRRAVAVVAAVGVRHRAGNLRGTVSAVVAEESAIAVHQAGNQRGVRRRTRNIPADNPRGVVDINRFVAVLFHCAFQAFGDGVQRFIPGDAFELPFTAKTYALHRVVQAFRVIDTATNRASTQASAYLMIAIHVMPGVIGFNPGDFIIANVQTQGAATSAVH